MPPLHATPRLHRPPLKRGSKNKATPSLRDAPSKEGVKQITQTPSLEGVRERSERRGSIDRFDALVNDLKSGLPAEIALRRKQYEYYRDKLLTFQPLE